MDSMSSKRVLNLKVNTNGRVTIPYDIRDYFEFPDLNENDVYVEMTIHGLDPNKHPDHPMAAEGGDE